MALREQKKNPTCCPLRGFIKRGKKKTAKCFLLNDPKKKTFCWWKKNHQGATRSCLLNGINKIRGKQNHPRGPPGGIPPRGHKVLSSENEKKKLNFSWERKPTWAHHVFLNGQKKLIFEQEKRPGGPKWLFCFRKWGAFFGWDFQASILRE